MKPRIITLLSRQIKAKTGLNIEEFCERHLNTKYKTFQYRMRTKRYYPAEVIYICWLLNDTPENIFGDTVSALILFQGPPEIAGKLVEIFNGADEEKRARLKRLIEFMPGSQEIPQKEEEKRTTPSTYKKPPEPVDTKVDIIDAPEKIGGEKGDTTLTDFYVETF